MEQGPAMREQAGPEPKNRKFIEGGAKAGHRKCWTCGSCDFECPVNVAAGRLRP
jgi:hypothetical protein